MRIKNILLFFIVLLWAAKGSAQFCSNLGQTPSTSFPVCGTATFIQSSVPLCAGSQIPGPCGAGLLDKNPFWYRFTCYVTGTLGFLITPFNLADDYDWQLFDITGRNANDIYTDPSLFVACNWSGFPGITGASAAGTSLINCDGNVPIFSSMPSLSSGRDYILLISHFTNTQSGYQLSFTGGTAGITDPANPIPEVTTASVSCDATQVTIRFNKKVKCSSLALNGSDFTLAPSGTVLSAVGNGCSSSFELDSVTLTLAAPLDAGNYIVTAKNGADGNTLLDNCDRGIAQGDDAAFTVVASPPLPMGAVNPPSCAPASLTLTFPEPVRCNTIAADGSDFTITGPSVVTVSAATAVSCVNGETNAITIQLTTPILVSGNYQLLTTTGSDGNTIIGQCNRRITAGAPAAFTIAPQPAITMGTITPPPCTPSSVTLTFADPINCSTVAANGSDFIVTGPSAVTVVAATAITCLSNETYTINIQFAGPVLTNGNYQVQVATGSDGNTLIGQCNRQVTAGITAPFTLAAQPPLPIGTITPPSCSPSSITVNFTDPMDCTSVSPDGSEFLITGPSGVVITGAAGQCNINPGISTITIQLAAPIAASGTYQLTVKTGTDGNTIRGDCNRYIAVNDLASFTIPDAPAVTMDSLVPVACSPSSLRLIFAEPIRCASVAANGSDFIVTGPSPVTVVSAAGTCDANGFTKQIDIQLTSPVVMGGNYQLQLTTGSDGNTLLSECYRATPVNALYFIAGDTVSAEFQHHVQYDCENDLITFLHDGLHDVNQWTWTVNGVAASTDQTFAQSFSASSQNQVQLVVTNGLCSDTYAETIVLNNKVVAAFDGPDMVCPEDSAGFSDKSTGQIDNWQWTFGNGNSSSLQLPPAQVYPTTGIETLYTVSLTVSNNSCQTTAVKTVKVFASCIIAVPTAFTPDNDGLNDYLYPLNAIKAEQLDFKIFTRWGQLVFQSRDWTKKWDGKINGIPQATSVYVWTLNYIHKDTKIKYSLKGTTTLIR